MSRPNYTYRPQLCIHGNNEVSCRTCINDYDAWLALQPKCDYCGGHATEVSLTGTHYCSLECLCRFQVKRQAVLDYDTHTDFTTLPEED
jgi:hypothetical protein